jgi:hypothetical protein
MCIIISQKKKNTGTKTNKTKISKQASSFIRVACNKLTNGTI